MKVLRELLTGTKVDPDARASELFASLTAEIARRIPETKNLETRLEAIAGAIATLPGIAGAAVIASTEDGIPLSYGLKDIGIRNKSQPLLSLRFLSREKSVTDDWQELDSENQRAFEIPGATSLRVWTLIDDRPLGWFIIAASEDSELNATLTALEKSRQYLNWILRDALYLLQTQCIRDLREIELEQLGLRKQIQPAEIAKQLKEVFRAKDVTVLWQEQGRLYLSTSTDKALERQADVVYDPGKGFTGHIFQTGEAVLLRNAIDKQEIRAKLGRKIAKDTGVIAFHPEALAGRGVAFQFLAVPMRYSARRESQTLQEEEIGTARFSACGVVRVLRNDTDPPFTFMEREALQHFSDLLGFAMLSNWRWQLTEHILKAETEANCISRNDIGKSSRGQAVPRIVYGDPGSEVLFGLKNRNQDQEDGPQLYGMDARELYAEGEYNRIRKILRETIRNGKTACGPLKTKVKRFIGSQLEYRSVEISYRLLRSPFVIPPAHYTISVIRDITADQHLLDFLGRRGLAYFRTDEHGIARETSIAEIRLTGYSKQELLGESRAKIYHESNGVPRLTQAAREADGELVDRFERLKRKDGSAFWAEGAARLIRGRDGKEAGYEGLYEDVTERLQLQEFLDLDPRKPMKERELYDKMAENARLQLLFMTSLGHQLRSPLGALVGHLENFSKGITDASRFANHLRYSIGQAKVCAQMAANLFYMDKILRGESFRFSRFGSCIRKPLNSP